eukprot:5556447-Amphidinium_carterae.1
MPEIQVARPQGSITSCNHADHCQQPAVHSVSPSAIQTHTQCIGLNPLAHICFCAHIGNSLRHLLQVQAWLFAWLFGY